MEEDEVDKLTESLFEPIGCGYFSDHFIHREDRASLSAPRCWANADSFNRVDAVFEFGTDALIGFGQDAGSSLMDYFPAVSQVFESDDRVVTFNRAAWWSDVIAENHLTLSFSANIAALNNESAARQFVKDVCKSTTDPKSTCKRTSLAGPAYGYLGVWSQDNDSTKTASVVSQFVGEQRLVEVNCFPVGGTVDKPMTTKEIKACSTGIVKVSAAIIGE